MMNDNILETIRMIEEQKLDIRTVTMGISLLDCADSDGEVAPPQNLRQDHQLRRKPRQRLRRYRS